MTENKDSGLLKVALILFAIVAVGYGITLLFFTQGFIEMSGSEAIDPTWIQWPGGVLIALGYGALRVLRNPVNQDIIVKVIAFATLFTGLALLYTLIFKIQPEDSTWFTAMPAIINLVMSALLWWGGQQAKEVLKQA